MVTINFLHSFSLFCVLFLLNNFKRYCWIHWFSFDWVSESELFIFCVEFILSVMLFFNFKNFIWFYLNFLSLSEFLTVFYCFPDLCKFFTCVLLYLSKHPRTITLIFFSGNSCMSISLGSVTEWLLCSFGDVIFPWFVVIPIPLHRCLHMYRSLHLF